MNTAEKNEKIRQLLSQNPIGIFWGTVPDEAEYLAGEALRSALEAANKNVIMPLAKDSPFPQWQGLVSRKANASPPAALHVRIPKKNKIKEVSYEERGDFFDFSILPEKGQINPQEIIMESETVSPASAFCFFEDEQRISEMQKDRKLPVPESIAVISRTGRTLSEKTAEIITLLGNNSLNNKQTATLLFACLVVETDNFAKHTSKEILTLAGMLLEYGADKTAIKQIQFTDRADSQLLGRALARTHTDNLSGVAWTFITWQDLEKTRNSPSRELFAALAKSLRQVVPERKGYLFLWQERTGAVTGKFFSEDEKILQLLTEPLHQQPKFGALDLPVYGTFTEAETKLRQLLKARL